MGSGQMVIQGAAFLTGILIVRSLTPTEYAFYTLAYTMLGTMTVLADCGVASAVLSEGGKVWTDREKLGTVVVTGLKFRGRLAVASLAIAVPLLTYFLYSHQAPASKTVALVALICGMYATSFFWGIYEIPLRLHQRISELLKINISQALMRFSLIGVAIYFFPYAPVAIALTLLAQALALPQLVRYSRKMADFKQQESEAVRFKIWKTVKRMFPDAVYYCFSGQLTIWLASIFGTTNALANIGALGRMGQILTILSAFVGTVITPRFSRLPVEKSGLLLKRFLQVLLLATVVSALLVVAVAIVPSASKIVLGPQYSNLGKETILIMINAAITGLSGIIFALAASRGFVVPPQIAIPLSILFQVIAIVVFDLKTVSGIICVGILTSLVTLLLHVTNAIIALTRQSKS